jgi:hypothetical protein
LKKNFNKVGLGGAFKRNKTATWQLFQTSLDSTEDARMLNELGLAAFY